MKIAYVLLENFAASVEVSSRPELAGKPVIVGGLPHERKTVYDLSPEASSYGIKLGISLRQASQLCPEAEFLKLDLPKYERAFEEVLEVLDSFSPRVEVDGPGRAFVDLTGAERYYGGEEKMLYRLSRDIRRKIGIKPMIGLAGSKHIAKLVSHLAQDAPVVIPHGAEMEFLKPLPVDVLPCSEETKRRLRFLGLRTIEHVASLPKRSLVPEFGREGEFISGFIRRTNYDPVIPRHRARIFRESISFDDPVTNSRYLLSAIERSLRKLNARLEAEYSTCSSLDLEIKLEDGRKLEKKTSFRYPAQNTADLIRPVSLALEEMDYQAGASGVSVSLSGIRGESGEQSSFLPEQGIKREKLNRIAWLVKRYGSSSSLQMASIVDKSSSLAERRFSMNEIA